MGQIAIRVNQILWYVEAMPSKVILMMLKNQELRKVSSKDSRIKFQDSRFKFQE